MCALRFVSRFFGNQPDKKAEGEAPPPEAKPLPRRPGNMSARLRDKLGLDEPVSGVRPRISRIPSETVPPPTSASTPTATPPTSTPVGTPGMASVLKKILSKPQDQQGSPAQPAQKGQPQPARQPQAARPIQSTVSEAIKAVASSTPTATPTPTAKTPEENTVVEDFAGINHKRARWVSIAMLIGYISLFLKAFYLQAITTDDLQNKGEQRYLRKIQSPALRGRILDRNGNPLAVSTPMYAIWAVPEQAADITSVQRQKLAELLDVKESDMSRRLEMQNDFVYLQRKIPPEIADKINKMKLPGIHSQKESRRYYPSNEIAAHVIGSTNSDDKGVGGAELIFQDQLQGVDGRRVVIKDRRGRFVEDMVDATDPVQGQDVTLSIDSNLQYIAYTQLKQAVQTSKAKAGSAIILDSRTGEILALVNLPTYDPNSRVTTSSAFKRNRAITDVFEPGSTMKAFTVALALDLGRVLPETVFPTYNGKIQLDGVPITDDHPKGNLNVKQIIQHSSNVGAAQIALRLSSREMWSMYDQLGLDRAPDIGFPYEASGIVRPWQQWRKIERATMAYGHGMAVSLVQLAHAYMTFARSGDIIPLSLRKVTGQPASPSPVFKSETVRRMREMLEMVVSDEGTAPKARIPGYRVGGKTGTAYKVEKGRYVKKYVSSFVGVAPLSDPRLVVGVVIDEPDPGTHYGGDIAAPVFSALMGASLRNMGIPQDKAGKIL